MAKALFLSFSQSHPQKMTKSHAEIDDGDATGRRGRRHPSLPAPASPLENEDILQEILLCLPPRPSSLPRASFVSRRWRNLVSDPQFRRRFRAHHRTPPLLGFYNGLNFVPTQDPPDRVPASRFSIDVPDDEEGGWYGCYRYCLSNCRGGLVLYFDRNEFLVFDPMPGHRHRVPSPVKEKDKGTVLSITAAVVPLAADSSRGHCSFRIVALFSNRSHGIRAFASVYSSDTGVWEDTNGFLPAEPTRDLMISRASTLVGNAIYWKVDLPAILEFDLDKQSLAVIQLPPSVDIGGSSMFLVMAAEGHQLGIATLSAHSIQSAHSIRFWARKADHGIPVRWVLSKTVHTNDFLPVECLPLFLAGIAEDSKVIFITTNGGVCLVHIETMQSRKVLDVSEMSDITPYSGF